jgi:hypothetical protein
MAKIYILDYLLHWCHFQNEGKLNGGSTVFALKINVK